jgi:hypothetical protein
MLVGLLTLHKALLDEGGCVEHCDESVNRE